MLIPSHAEEGKGEEETEGFDIARVFEVCELDKARGSCSVIPCPSPTPPHTCCSHSRDERIRDRDMCGSEHKFADHAAY